MTEDRIPITREELVRKLLEGEKDFRFVRLVGEKDLTVLDGFLSLTEDTSASDLGKGFDVNFTNSDFSGLRAPALYMDRLQGGGVIFENAMLECASFEYSYFMRANFKSAYLRGATLKGSKLREADMAGAYLERASLVFVDTCDPCHFGRYSGANLSGAHLSNADLCHANLRFSSLRGANVYDASFEDADLRDVDLSGIVHLANAMGLDTAVFGRNKCDDKKVRRLIRAAHGGRELFD